MAQTGACVDSQGAEALRGPVSAREHRGQSVLRATGSSQRHTHWILLSDASVAAHRTRGFVCTDIRGGLNALLPHPGLKLRFFELFLICHYFFHKCDWNDEISMERQTTQAFALVMFLCVNGC